MLMLSASCSQKETTTQEVRPQEWAQAVALGGVPNLHKVSEELYRSAQPSAEGMANLEKLGIRTVVNLRALSSDADEVGALSLKQEEIPILTWTPSDEVDEEFFEILERSPKPVLVHCKHGADRTGALCALYRVRKQEWSVENALAEMRGGGFGFHEIWGNLPRWVRTQAGSAR